MGIFDFPAPFFYFIDKTLGFLPDFVRLVFWSTLAGAFSMACYAWISPQSRISNVKVALREAQGMLATSDESFAELRLLIKRTLLLALKHLMLVFIPALISSLPLIWILVWSSSQFGYQFPKPGETISFNAQPTSAGAKLKWLTESAGTEYVSPKYNGAVWSVNWPGTGHSLSLSDERGNQLMTIPPPLAIPQIHKQMWWNSLLGNPLGYLPRHSTVDLVEIDLPSRQYLPGGPAWFNGWLTLFFIVATCSALLIKWLFRIH
jgi:hypothetical protein